MPRIPRLRIPRPAFSFHAPRVGLRRLTNNDNKRRQQSNKRQRRQRSTTNSEAADDDDDETILTADDRPGQTATCNDDCIKRQSTLGCRRRSVGLLVICRLSTTNHTFKFHHFNSHHFNSIQHHFNSSILLRRPGDSQRNIVVGRLCSNFVCNHST